MRRTRLSAALAALTLTAALAGTATAAAAPAGADPTAVPLCAKGYVCVEQGGGVITLVPEGGAHDFDPPVRIVSVVNSTIVGYCLTGSYNTGIAPGGVFEPTTGYTLNRLTPSPSGFCSTTDG
ncbi:hypothetical protein GCM10010400_17900 [Streptomyces aculeolatus]|uniref:hypothetical protein n=1 Tax=Streptomyces aculeolatus TaxID=270689 RepID=UPI001CED2962|nr:hypothetical protein [Streptomyces aculeolatus]